MDHGLGVGDGGPWAGPIVGRRFRFAALVGAALLAGACGGQDTDPGVEPAPSPEASLPSPTPTEPPQTPDQAVLAAFEGMWAAYDQAGRAPAADPDHRRLAEYAAGDALEGLRSALGRLRDEGLVFEGSYVSLSPTVVELSPAEEPTTAKVEDCRDGSGWVVVRADGGEYEDEPGGRRAIFADVELSDDGTWRVTSFAVREAGSC